MGSRLRQTSLHSAVAVLVTAMSLSAQHLEVESLPAVVGSAVVVRPLDRQAGPMFGLDVVAVEPSGKRHRLLPSATAAHRLEAFEFVPQVAGLHTFEAMLPETIPADWPGRDGLQDAVGAKLVTPVHVAAANTRWFWFAWLTPVGVVLLGLHLRRILGKRAQSEG